MLNFYSLYDMKVKHYHVPFYAHTDPEALSMIRDQLSSGHCPSLSEAISDLQLFKIGTFSDLDGSFHPSGEFVDFDLSSFRKEE